MEHIVDLLELGALAQMVGAIAIIISLFLVLVELRKNLQQHLLSNTLARSIEVEKMHYQQMDESMADLIVKGKKSYSHLDENEKIRLESYLMQKLAIYSRGYTIAAASAYGQPTQHLKDRIHDNIKAGHRNSNIDRKFVKSVSLKLKMYDLRKSVFFFYSV